MLVILYFAALISAVLARSRSSCVTDIVFCIRLRKIWLTSMTPVATIISRAEKTWGIVLIRTYTHSQIGFNRLTSTRCCCKGCISEMEIQFGVSVNRRCLAACFQQLHQRRQKEGRKSVDMFQVRSRTLPLLQCQIILKFVLQRIPTPNSPAQHNCRLTSITTRYLWRLKLSFSVLMLLLSRYVL